MSSDVIAQEFPFATDASKLQEEMDTILDCGMVNRHSFFQLKYFVVAKEYTTQSRMWCCIRELQARKTSIDSLKRQIEELRDDKELVQLEIKQREELFVDTESKFTGLDKQVNTVHVRKMNRKVEALDQAILEHQKKLKDAEEEAAFLAMAYRQLEKTESLRPFDDLESQTKYWNEKLTQELNLRLLTRHPLDLELVKTILALNDETPIKQQTVRLLKQLEMQPMFESQSAKKALEEKKKDDSPKGK